MFGPLSRSPEIRSRARQVIYLADLVALPARPVIRLADLVETSSVVKPYAFASSDIERAVATAVGGTIVVDAVCACCSCCSSGPSEVVHRIKNSNTCPGDAPEGTCMSIRIVSPESCAPNDMHTYIVLTHIHAWLFLDKQAQQHNNVHKNQFIPIVVSEGR